MTEFTKTSRQRPFDVKTFNDRFEDIFGCKDMKETSEGYKRPNNDEKWVAQKDDHFVCTGKGKLTYKEQDHGI